MEHIQYGSGGKVKTLTKTSVSYRPTKLISIILNYLNHNIARKNIKNNPQLVIFSFDHIGLTINLEGRYEKLQLDLVERMIVEKIPNAKDAIALDIGANIGNHSLFFSNYFNKVYSFEPNPITYDVLLINCKYNTPKKNIIPYNFGLSESERELPFIIDRSNIGGSKIQTSHEVANEDEKTTVQVKKVDDIEFPQKKPISLIKIDVEGHEFKALKGAEKIIKSNKPLILFEQGKDEIFGGSSKVIDYLASFNYNFYTIQKRFYFGESFISKSLGFILRSAFGEQLSFVETKRFQNRYYDMILAIPS